MDIDYDLIDDDKINTDTFFKNLSPWVLRLQLSSKQLAYKNLKGKDIKDIILKHYTDRIFNIINLQKTDPPALRIRVVNDETTSPAEKAEQGEYLKTLEIFLLDQVPIKGIPGITKVLYRENKNKRNWINPDGSYELDENDKWVLETDGTNLKEVLNMEQVDSTRTVSNHIYEIWEILGIEAVRQALITELRFVLDSYGIYVNYRHLGILCDCMTLKGSLMSITRNGINRIDG